MIAISTQDNESSGAGCRSTIASQRLVLGVVCPPKPGAKSFDLGVGGGVKLLRRHTLRHGNRFEVRIYLVQYPDNVNGEVRQRGQPKRLAGRAGDCV